MQYVFFDDNHIHIHIHIFFSIDFYCQGIGYFTIPIAVKTGVKKMLCFEINEDSVMSLKRNIQQNGVESICEVGITINV